jgi:hypothetical protein
VGRCKDEEDEMATSNTKRIEQMMKMRKGSTKQLCNFNETEKHGMGNQALATRATEKCNDLLKQKDDSIFLTLATDTKAMWSTK